MISSFCKTDTPMCVDVDGLDTDRIVVSSTKARKGRSADYVVSFDREEWQAFVDGVKAGEFDLKPQHEEIALEQLEQV